MNDKKDPPPPAAPPRLGHPRRPPDTPLPPCPPIPPHPRNPPLLPRPFARSPLQGQLSDAVAREDFSEAASLKKTISSVRRDDPVAKVERGFRAAVASEDYAAAARYRDAGAGLVGWWSGRGLTDEEPGGAYGAMMHVTARHGRYVGTSYSARDLAVLQERARRGRMEKRRNRGGASGDTSSAAGGAEGGEGDASFGGGADEEEVTGRAVFELWLEEDPETGEWRRRAVRLDSVPVGLEGLEDALEEDALDEKSRGAGFVGELGGFPVDGPVVEPGGEPKPGASSAGEASSAPRSEFETWRVRGGVVSAPLSADSPFPFDVNGVSMDELMSYEARGFMAEFARLPGFAENWARLKAEAAAEAAEEETGEARDASDSAASLADALEELRAASEAATLIGGPNEPRDDFFFDRWVVNETVDGDAAALDLDDFDLDDVEAFELEEMLDDEDALDAAAASLLSDRSRRDPGFDLEGGFRIPKGLPASALAKIQRAIEARGLGRAVYPDDETAALAAAMAEEEDDGDESGNGGSSGSRSNAGVGFGNDDDDARGAVDSAALDDADFADGWETEEVRVPARMSADSLHAFRLVSELEDDPDGLDPTRRGAQMERTLREAAAAEAEVEAAVLRGLADAKARAAEELRAAANAAAVVRGETEMIMVDLDNKAPEGETSKPAEEEDGEEEGSDDEGEEEEASRTSTNAGDSTNGGPEVSASLALDAPDGPAAVSSDGVASRLGSAPRKSAGERLFERLSEAASAEDDGREKASESSPPDASAPDASAPSPPRGFISPESFRDAADSDSGDDHSDASEGSSAYDSEEARRRAAALDAFGLDQDHLPLPHRARFSRVPPSVARRSSSDPFDRLYLGAFGPHGPEVLRMVRGRWGDELGEGDDRVTAVKLTGDANVPAGAASFRAEIGADKKLDASSAYPEELGVVARYKGQGRVAKPGFAERNWVDGELLLLDGRGGQLTGGAELGFVWAVPGERRLLILFSSLELPEAVPPVGMYVD